MKLWQIGLGILVVAVIAFLIYNSSLEFWKANLELGMMKDKYGAKESIWQLNEKKKMIDLRKEMLEYQNKIKGFNGEQANEIKKIVESEINALQGMIFEKELGEALENNPKCSNLSIGMEKINKANANFEKALQAIQEIAGLAEGQLSYIKSNELNQKISSNNRRILDLANYMALANCA